MRPGSIAPARGAVHVGTCSLPAALSEGPFLCRPRRRSLRGLELLTLNMFPSKELEFHHPRWDQGPGREVTYQSAWVLHPELKSSDSWDIFLKTKMSLTLRGLEKREALIRRPALCSGQENSKT
ncbi:small integral membrane protein 11A isoform X1 [Prionailurus bengalensis]|uniref:small integral membrane protein 11A isoform X1 n=1 Tax=Prionailurus bengalensis TaxID=37029 RepID=UPI001CA9710D|nr:small integral membrane protein 11A isoform X1 [Prionailurus bengalensis]XP_043449590.1 small integral membrane protein 11A isoform X1 [Prionailurus bengalensis]XP_043449591.1 small integral membrane protein 11A isoform X1 [Prionailurus bengalensis]